MGDLHDKKVTWEDPPKEGVIARTPDEIPVAEHFQVFTYATVYSDDGYGGSNAVEIPTITIYYTQKALEDAVTAYKMQNHGKQIWVQKSLGRLSLETRTTVKVTVK